MSNQVLLKKSSVVAKVPTSGDLTYGEVALNYADGKLYFKNSSNTVQPLGIAYTKIIANTTAKINQGYICNTGAGSFTLTLPASPETGHYVIIVDDDAFGTNPLYVARNGNPIAGIAENLTIDITGVSVTLLWDGGSWNVYSQVGATGGSGSGGTEYNFGSFPQGLIPSFDNTYTLGNSSYKWEYVNSYGYRFGDNTTQTTAANVDGTSITRSSGVLTAQAGGLAGNTLNSGVTASSLQTLGTQTQRINWAGSGVAAPQFSSSSVGTKLLLYPNIGGSTADFAIGIDSATIWNGLPENSASYFFKWYGGTTNVATLTGAGALTLAGTLAVNSPTISTTSSGTASVFNANATTLNIGGASTTVSIGAGSGTTTVNNNLVVTGTFTVNGTTETINATTITVDDKNIELGSVASPTDVTADGGGITLKGATDKTFNWVDATDAWTSSEHMNLLTGKAYYIAGTSVLNATTLGSAVVTSSLTTVGTIGTGTWQGTLVAGQYGGTGVNNSGKTITLGGNLTTSGAFATTFTTTSTTSVTLPTSGTLATLAGTETFTNKTLTNPIISTISNTGTLTLPTSTDTLVGRATTDTLTNKTIAAGSNTISGLTNSNLSGTAGITNANLANSSITIGTTAISLGSSSTTIAGLNDINFNTSPTVTLAAGKQYWNADHGGLEVAFNANTSATLGQDQFYYAKASSAITKGQLCYFTGVVGASGIITAAPATSGITNPSYMVGIAAESISLNSFGYIQTFGLLKGFNTSAFTEGAILYYDSVNGGMTSTYPTTGILVQVAAVINSGSGASGSVLVRLTTQQRLTGSAGVTVTQTASGSAFTVDSTVATLTGTQTLTNKTLTSPTLTTPVLGTPTSGNFSTGTFTWPTFNQSTTGSAATLTTSRNINGVAFNGSADITVTAAAGTLSGATLASGVTASSLTSVGTLTSLSTSGSITSTAAATTPTINSFANVTSYANNATVDFANFSGLIIVNRQDAGSGNVALWIVGSAGSVKIADSTGNQSGIIAVNSGVNGYRWTNNTGGTISASFMTIKTRDGA